MAMSLAFSAAAATCFVWKALACWNGEAVGNWAVSGASALESFRHTLLLYISTLYVYRTILLCIPHETGYSIVHKL